MERMILATYYTMILLEVVCRRLVVTTAKPST
jgi:hypothetical protein